MTVSTLRPNEPGVGRRVSDDKERYLLRLRCGGPHGRIRAGVPSHPTRTGFRSYVQL